MGIKNIINKAGAKAADKVAKLSALSPEQLKQVEEQREKYLADQPNISDEELTNRLLASCGVEIFNSYLEQIKELYVPIENKVEFGTDFQESYNIRYFNITKWVVDKKENSLENWLMFMKYFLTRTVILLSSSIELRPIQKFF